ncbi:hypothetical protein [Sphingobium sp. EM0848]|uniref:hypothetical protein n=1 Tax=Sphingobium sp. EM0848 TaxID=2743473 RepID=UPI00159C43D8|nr:hypothetical protein [Sphingobium sp. EM0848]
MARTLEQERAAIEAEQQKLAGRMKALEDKEREVAIATVERSGLLKVEGKRLTSLMDRIRTLGIDEVQKRLGS